MSKSDEDLNELGRLRKQTAFDSDTIVELRRKIDRLEAEAATVHQANDALIGALTASNVARHNLERRNAELLAANNAYLERARLAEAMLVSRIPQGQPAGSGLVEWDQRKGVSTINRPGPLETLARSAPNVWPDNACEDVA